MAPGASFCATARTYHRPKAIHFDGQTANLKTSFLLGCGCPGGSRKSLCEIICGLFCTLQLQVVLCTVKQGPQLESET